MGLVLCETHGRTDGRLCCEHIRRAVRECDHRLRALEFEVDVADEGRARVRHAFCEACAAAYGIEEGCVTGGRALGFSGLRRGSDPVL